MYFAIKNNKVILAHRELEVVQSVSPDSVIEQAESSVVNFAYPEKLKVVDGVIVDKTNGEITSEENQKKKDAIKEIRKLHIVDSLIEFGKINDAVAALNADSIKKFRWDSAQMIKVDDADFLALLSAIGVTVDEILEDYEA